MYLGTWWGTFAEEEGNGATEQQMPMPHAPVGEKGDRKEPTDALSEPAAACEAPEGETPGQEPSVK